jgi:hypothetical protein
MPSVCPSGYKPLHKLMLLSSPCMIAFDNNPNLQSSPSVFGYSRSASTAQLVLTNHSLYLWYSPCNAPFNAPSEIHSPAARLMDGINNNAAAKAPSNVPSLFDMKRLRSKPAPPQQLQYQQQSSSSMGLLEERQNAPYSTAMAGGTDDQPGRVATKPNEQHDSLVSPLTTMLSSTQPSSQASTSKLRDSTKSRDNDERLTMPLSAEHRAGPSASNASNFSYHNNNSNNSRSYTYPSGENCSQPQYLRSESNSSDHQWHVDSSSSQQQQYYSAGPALIAQQAITILGQVSKIILLPLPDRLHRRHHARFGTAVCLWGLLLRCLHRPMQADNHPPRVDHSTL